MQYLRIIKIQTLQVRHKLINGCTMGRGSGLGGRRGGRTDKKYIRNFGAESKYSQLQFTDSCIIAQRPYSTAFIHARFVYRHHGAIHGHYKLRNTIPVIVLSN